MSEWIFKGKPIKEAPDNQIGFIYCITNLSNHRQYIGKKFLLSKRRKKVAGRKNRKVVIKESDWKDYYGSNKVLLADLEQLGVENFRREILKFFPSKKQVSYAETEMQMKLDVLRKSLGDGTPAYYNDNILGKYFRKDLVV
jgi:Putative endonuclease segE, GIY-YIG domain